MNDQLLHWWLMQAGIEKLSRVILSIVDERLCQNCGSEEIVGKVLSDNECILRAEL